MKLSIPDENIDLRIAIFLVVGWAVSQQDGIKSGGSKQTPADAAAKPDKSQTTEQATTGPNSEKAANFPSEQSRKFRILIPVVVFIGIVFSAYLVFCLAFLLPSYGKDFDKDVDPSFNASTDVPLFYGAVIIFIWKAATQLKWRSAGRFETAIYQSPFFHAAQWVACAVLQVNGDPIITIALYPFFEETQDIDRRVFCHLHTAYEQGLPAKIVYWVLVAMVGVGYLAVCAAFGWIKLTSAVSFMKFMYGKLRQPCLLYLLCPLRQRVLEPLFRLIMQPLCRVTLTPLGAALHQYVLLPLERVFPGPSTKTEHYFAEPTVNQMANIVFTAPPFIAVSSITIFNASENDSHLWQQKSSSNILLHLGIFYTLVVWMVWRSASALNFAPAVRLDRAVFSSRIGRTLHGLIILPWLYSLWRVGYFVGTAFVCHEGTIERFFLSNVKMSASFAIGSWELDPVGYLLEKFLVVVTNIGFCFILGFLGLAIEPYFRKAARFANSRPWRLYKPAASIPILDGDPCLEANR